MEYCFTHRDIIEKKKPRLLSNKEGKREKNKLTCGGYPTPVEKQPLVVHIVVPEAVRPPHTSREAYSLKQNLQASH